MPAAEVATPIRILLIEDNLLTRVGIETLLQTQPDLQVVGRAGDGEQGVHLYKELLPDLVITDLRMPGMDGVATTENLVHCTPPAKVLLLTNYDGDESIFRAVKAGALGYLTKDTNPQPLYEAARTVAAGQRYLPVLIAAKFAERSLRKGLSPREQQVLESLQAGLANKEVATQLGLSDKTVQMYVASILEKLGAQSRTEAVAIATGRGILLTGR